MIRTKNLNIEMKNYNITKIDKRSTSDKKYRDRWKECDFCDILYEYTRVTLTTRLKINK